MMVILVGANKATLLRVRGADAKKHFLLFRGELYKTYPDGLTRLIVRKFGRRVKTDEVIVYKENAIVPYDCRSQLYTMGKILSEIDNHKKSIGKKRGLFGAYEFYALGHITTIWRTIAPAMPMIIAGVVLLWAVVFN